ncbi:MAG: PIG-L family deacetylase [Anaerolineales bacterium]|nr:PIG-L family deacetylase [Anaerolineales bacterium]
MKRTILSVLAHPDDESFGMGGTLAKYAASGVDVHLICATRGEAGEVDPEYLEGYSSIANLRVHELNCAVKELGIEPVRMLKYRDSGMTGSADNQHPQALINASLDQVAGEIADTIREIKPQVVLTFDPIGGYRHPDHIFIHEAATKAFKLAGDPEHPGNYPPFQPERLFYHTIPRYFIQFNVRLLKRLGKDPTKYGKNHDIDLTQMAVDEFPVHARINYAEYKDRKVAAAACHVSQGGHGLTRGFVRWLSWLLGARSVDQFMQAIPEPNSMSIKEDLFL